MIKTLSKQKIQNLNRSLQDTDFNKTTLTMTDKVDYNDTFLTVEQAAELFHVNAKTMYRKIQEGKVPSLRVAGKVLIPKNKAIDAGFDAQSTLKQEEP